MIYILFLDAGCIVRYCFVFHTKNPTAFQHDFWKMFLCMWIYCFGIMAHIVFALLPGKNPNYFYICLGRMPINLMNQPFKINWILNIGLMISFCAHLSVSVKYQIFKFKEKQIINPILPMPMISSHTMANKSNLATFATNFFGMASLIFFGTVPAFKINFMDIETLNTYPNYLWAYIMYLYSIPILFIVIILLVLSKNSKLFEFTKKEIRDAFNFWFLLPKCYNQLKFPNVYWFNAPVVRYESIIFLWKTSYSTLRIARYKNII